MRLVPVPTNPHAHLVLSTKHLADPGRRSAKSLYCSDHRSKPCWNRLGLLQPPQRVVVTEPERGHPPLAFIGAELERLQRQGPDAVDQFALDIGRDEFRGVLQAFGRARM